MNNVDPIELALIIAFLVLSLGVHEAAHAGVAYLRGDTTARDLGRLTLNPLAHIDPFFTILLPTVLYMTVGFIFGGAKPVPVNPNRLRHPLRDMMLVALAGPVSNLLLAFLFSVVFKILVYVVDMPPSALAPRVMQQAVFFNLVLAIFNMIPIPPLDGSRVMAYLLPAGLRETYVGLERMGMLIVFVLLFTGVFRVVLDSTFYPMLDFVNMVTGGVWT